MGIHIQTKSTFICGFNGVGGGGSCLKYKYYPGQKEEPSLRFAARRTLFHVWYHARSGAISAGQKSRTVADRTCPALIPADQAWYHTWNSVLLASNLDDGSFFVQGSTSLESIVFCYTKMALRACWQYFHKKWLHDGRSKLADASMPRSIGWDTSNAACAVLWSLSNVANSTVCKKWRRRA